MRIEQNRGDHGGGVLQIDLSFFIHFGLLKERLRTGIGDDAGRKPGKGRGGQTEVFQRAGDVRDVRFHGVYAKGGLPCRAVSFQYAQMIRFRVLRQETVIQKVRDGKAHVMLQSSPRKLRILDCRPLGRIPSETG